MKLISKFRDYYDGVTHQYRDEHILYIREQKEIEFARADFEKLPYVSEAHHYSNYLVSETRAEFLISFRIMGFCGKLYPFVAVKERFTDNRYFFYSFHSFNDFVTSAKLTLDHGIKRWRWSKGYDTTYLSEYVKFFNNRDHYTNLEAKFHELNAPCFLYREGANQNRKIITNPMLKKFGFAKLKDPYSAHQELYQFVGGYLNQPERPMVEISDKDKIHKHGFDEWSFRQKGPKK